MLNLKTAMPINYQSFQRDILYFSLQRKRNSKILQEKHVKMCNQRNCNYDVELKTKPFSASTD